MADSPGEVDAALAERQLHDLDLLLKDYRKCWDRRNRPGGLGRSTAKLLQLRGEYAALAGRLRSGSSKPAMGQE